MIRQAKIGTIGFVFAKKSTNVALIVISLVITSTALVSLSTLRANKGWRGVRDDVLVQLMPSTQKAQINIVNRPFITDVDVGVVVDADSKYQFVSFEMLDEWGIDEDALYEQAMKNLNAISRNIKVEVAQASETDKTAKYIIVELDDGYASARILSEGIRKAIARELGESYIAAIPTRDFLIFWHKDFVLFDAFADQVQEESDAEEEYPLTPILLMVNSAGIQEMMKVAQ